MGDFNAIHISSQAQAHIAAYLEYRAIVGDADGGKLLSEEEYAQFRARAMEARKNRIYVNYRCKTTGMDCKVIGPQSKCFCQHKYQQHATDNYESLNIHCRAKGCACAMFESIPSQGAWVAKCTCKHAASEHDETGVHRCKRMNCQCRAFHSSWSCSCGRPWSEHHTVFETREQRAAAGRPVDNLAGGGAGYAALGGLTNFSSLVDGVDRIGDAPRPMLLEGDVPAAGAQISYEEGVYLTTQGKMTQEDEFALYEQKYKKSSARVPVSKLPSARRPQAASQAAAPPPAWEERGSVAAAAPLSYDAHARRTAAAPAAAAAGRSLSAGYGRLQRASYENDDAADQLASAAAQMHIAAPASRDVVRVHRTAPSDPTEVSTAASPFDLMRRPHALGDAPGAAVADSFAARGQVAARFVGREAQASAAVAADRVSAPAAPMSEAAAFAAKRQAAMLRAQQLRAQRKAEEAARQQQSG